MQVLYFVTTRRLAGIDSAATQQFYAGLVATVCLAPFGLSSGWVWPHRPLDWFFFALIGFAAFAGHLIFSTALRFARASLLAPFAYLQIIFMTLSSWLIFSEPPDVWIYVGAPVVVASGLYIWLRERRLQLQTSLQPVAD
jgi:drug/metabolite transporter (DMT)-like permease